MLIVESPRAHPSAFAAHPLAAFFSSLPVLRTFDSLDSRQCCSIRHCSNAVSDRRVSPHITVTPRNVIALNFARLNTCLHVCVSHKRLFFPSVRTRYRFRKNWRKRDEETTSRMYHNAHLRLDRYPLKFLKYTHVWYNAKFTYFHDNWYNGFHKTFASLERTDKFFCSYVDHKSFHETTNVNSLYFNNLTDFSS